MTKELEPSEREFRFVFRSRSDGHNDWGEPATIHGGYSAAEPDQHEIYNTLINSNASGLVSYHFSCGYSVTLSKDPNESREGFMYHELWSAVTSVDGPGYTCPSGCHHIKVLSRGSPIDINRSR